MGERQAKALAYVIAVDMGYGHERAAFALRHLAPKKTYIVANTYEGIPEKEKRLWSTGRGLYEAVSRFKRVPLVGSFVFNIMDELQEIPPFYPRRDLSRPSLQVRQTYALIKNQNLCQDLISKLAKKPLPLVCTFFTPAFAAEEYGYPGDIYLVICDADMARAWVPYAPKKSRIKYFAPTGRVAERLRLYGVRPENIFLTGFPMPVDNIGGLDAAIVEEDIHRRMCKLDPEGVFASSMQKLLVARFGKSFCKFDPKVYRRPPSITFAVGGAGAQREMIGLALRSLAERIRGNEIAVNLVAGTHGDAAEYFEREIRLNGLVGARQKGMVRVFHETSRLEYFTAFAKLMRETDILWTKPSELSFTTGLGIPIIMAPTVGAQEDFNRKWLMQIGGGIDALEMQYMDEWLFDWITSGALARMAWNGYINAPTHGAYRIESILKGEAVNLPSLPLVV
ncbi:MAG: hypothetical protein UY72_C0010G0007 [Candidatus Uhrbacteria bacterium GW2011_GWD2_52_7]|uniref:Monogalactosyldiacylglycerol synthase n=1 Tax=Candidatus Uhrbacteria bacterium GW2011_GWD2_52_7 TaxID=1618989 RepID=A0A0G1ZQL1_9BACT|nr:MAG: hypothetical protein UY72_C0010G0007 [Candidatus Uhrbacteria bacterium GW2011_GWD2_52_7]